MPLILGKICPLSSALARIKPHTSCMIRFSRSRKQYIDNTMIVGRRRVFHAQNWHMYISSQFYYMYKGRFLYACLSISSFV